MSRAGGERKEGKKEKIERRQAPNVEGRKEGRGQEGKKEARNK